MCQETYKIFFFQTSLSTTVYTQHKPTCEALQTDGSCTCAHCYPRDICLSIQKCGQSHAALLTGCGCVITHYQTKPRGKNIYSVKRGWMSKNFFSPTCCTSGFFNFKWTLHLMFILTETWNFRRNRQKISAFFYQINALFCSDVPA